MCVGALRRPRGPGSTSTNCRWTKRTSVPASELTTRCYGRTMNSQTNPLASPTTGRRNVWRLTWVGVLAGAAVLLLWWFDPRQLPLPICTFRRVTGLYCPGCGATRATHELLQAQWLSALRDNALWVLSLPLVVYAAASETRRLLCGRTLPGHFLGNGWFLAAAVILALVFGVLRNIPVHPFVLLAPPS